MTLGDRIRQLRRQNNMTQYDLAQRLGMRPNHISRYESDRVRPSPRTISEMADALGVSKDELLKSDLRPANDSFNDKDLARLMRELDGMEDAERRAVKVILEAMVMKKQLREQLLKH